MFINDNKYMVNMTFSDTLHIIKYFCILYMYMFLADINDCAGVVCSNHGRCVDMIAEYMCVCDVGFTGKECETGQCI